jgi:sugar phosphate isomerase/epimerase
VDKFSLGREMALQVAVYRGLQHRGHRKADWYEQSGGIFLFTRGGNCMQESGHHDIRIGTLVPAHRGVDYMCQILPHGFESIQVAFGQTVGDDLHRYAQGLKALLEQSDRGEGDAESAKATPDKSESSGTQCMVSSVGVYGNPLIDDEALRSWQELIDTCEDLFGCSLVTGFAGRIPERPIPDSIGRFVEVFGPLAKRAADRGVRIAFENCNMEGDWDRGSWNIAHSPKAWEMMFDALGSAGDNVGLEWEPCHQMVSLIDPLPQLRKWAQKVFHVHGKDATVQWDVIKTRGLRSGEPYVYHRTPGFGDTNWTDVISTLRMAGYQGSIDIEGWHDPVYQGGLEMTGQVHALEYLKTCRGGEFVANPK